MIRKATSGDIDAVAAIYRKILASDHTTGWLPGIYPVKSTAQAAYERGELYVYEKDDEILAAMILNQKQMDAYYDISWTYPATDAEVMVMHTLVVDPDRFGQGIAREMVSYYEQFSREQGCTAVRIDTNAINSPARAMYPKLGYIESGIVPCEFNGIPGVNLVLLEKKL